MKKIHSPKSENLAEDLRLIEPWIALYLTDGGIKRITKTLRRLLIKYGEKRFCKEVAITLRSLNNRLLKERLLKEEQARMKDLPQTSGKLKPCPFCGGKAHYQRLFLPEAELNQTSFSVYCTNGDKSRGYCCQTRYYPELEFAHEAWNKRI